MRKLAIIALVSTLFIAGGVFAQQKAGKDGVYEELNFFDEAFERIRQDSVDSVSDTKLIDAAISGMLTGLDPRSSFLDEAAFKATQNPANDNVAAVGMVVTIENAQLKVISPQDGSPAAQSWRSPTRSGQWARSSICRKGRARRRSRARPILSRPRRSAPE